MTQELIINGLQADTGDLNVVFEYVTNLFGDIGKINLSRSYTISLPKTLRNAEIFDNPGKPAHESAMVRRYFSARYYRNGIDLLGDARAYLLRTSEKGYEIALVWSTMNGLQELSQSKATLNDLKDLPTLRWIGKKALYDLTLWEGDRIFLRLLEENVPFFSLKLCYSGDKLTGAVLNGEVMA